MNAPATPNQISSELNCRKLSLEELKRISMYSYMFSQGNHMFQKHSLRYIRDYYSIQQISEAELDEIDSYVETIFNNLIETNQHGDVKMDEKPRDRVKEITEDFGPLSLDELARNMIYSDWNRLVRKSGRPNREPTALKPDHLSDPFMSFFVKYVLRKGKTGDRAFDQMFIDVRKIFHTVLGETDYTLRLKAMLSAYNQNHAETPVTNQELKAMSVDIDFV